jgi:Rrf2 family protein
MLSRRASHALKALLELAEEPGRWRSTHALAMAQQLPEPMLEQLLLRLRRAGLLSARRGRLGGYRLAADAREISVAAVLRAVHEPETRPPSTDQGPGSAADQVTGALEQRLERARRRALEALTLEDLLFDLRSDEASQEGGGGLLLG